MQLKKRLLLIGGLLAVGLLAVGIGYAAIRGDDEDEAAKGNGRSGSPGRRPVPHAQRRAAGFPSRRRCLDHRGSERDRESLATGARRRAAAGGPRVHRSRRAEPLAVTRPASTRCCCSEPPRALATRWRTTCARARSTRPCRDEDPPLCGARRHGCTRLDRDRPARQPHRHRAVGTGSLHVPARQRGRSPFVEVLSTGARAIYERTGGDCP